MRVRVTDEYGESFDEDVEEMLVENPTLFSAEEIEDLRRGASIRVGGGAAPLLVICAVFEPTKSEEGT